MELPEILIAFISPMLMVGIVSLTLIIFFVGMAHLADNWLSELF